MYRCEDCSNVFETPGVMYDLLTTDPYPIKRAIYICPCCRQNDLIEVVECPECGEYFPEGELVLVETDDNKEINVCVECYEDNHFVPPNVKEDE